MKTFTVQIITPEETVFSGETQSLVLPSVLGEMEVLAGHAPAFIMLAPGAVKLRMPDTAEKTYTVEGGFVQISKSAVKILPEHITLLP